MATRFDAKYPLEVGSLVYLGYVPKRCGIVVAITEPRHQNPFYQTADVQWKNGKRERVNVRDLCCYRSLYLDHTRKANDMARSIRELEAIPQLENWAKTNART